MPDTNYLRGTTTTRSRMLLSGGAEIAVAVVLAVVVAAVKLPTGSLVAVAVVAALVLLFSGAGRITWGLRRRKVDLLPIMCLVWLVLLGLAAVLAPWLPLPDGRNATAALSQPTYLPPLKFADHILGTNSAGLDLFSRAIYGARTSLIISLTAITIGLLVGGLIGVIAGYHRKNVDRGIGILTNSLLAVPPLILLVAIAAILTPNIRNIAFELSLLTIPSMIRIARANTIAFAQREFVAAARGIGATRWRIILRELVPNVALPMLSMAVVMISALIVAEASLSFLGLGIQQPDPTWGNMISEAQIGDTIQNYPFIVIVPGVFLFLTVFSFNVLGEKAQQRWDPRSTKL